MIEKMDHINIVVSDLDAARDFFIKLGFREVISSRLSGEQFSIVTGLADIDAKFVGLNLPGSKTNLELIEYYSPRGGKDPQIGRSNQLGYRHLAFAVDDIEAEVARLQAAGVVFKSAIQVWEKTGKKLVYFYGPDGILLEFAQYPQ
ncbi:MAG TPA: VOC family protein [Smithellaceae bacterium]|nr:VOC family protein [Smithellaceae bacterium]